ncbi:M28 family metallopeptidase [Pedobacter metabolipauper]|uniref:Zn-dependent M28 family amino/carboxypeptidase n=1 Tax=Pedobacter metabolipauper TaxID=425513 RepID=A0A4R6STT4_9SPHI|nr:M28 family metallopeptidase [Pedobacter metabolipauper]TDQ07474.1 Zn-dependent M28 family amino/carboxypeptidase [Pedobacter metabolipauper]
MNKFLICVIAIGLFFTACQPEGNDLTLISPDSAAVKMINDTSFAKHMSILASDEFQGRKPFTVGETKSINYMKAQFSLLGLKPGNGDSYFQEVPMVEIKSRPDSLMVFKGAKGSIKASYLTQFVAGTKRVDTMVNLTNSPLVFVGYGIVAPEYKWNDYEGLDVKGKTVVVLINDPGFSDPKLFKGKNMTYYGRWTYKFEEAARQGAAGILIIHDTEPAAYPWSVVRSGWSKSKLQLDEKDDSFKSIVQGWISLDLAKQLFKLGGQSDALLTDALKPDFKPVDLKLTTALTINNTIKKSVSNNVVAIIPGSKRQDENIIYSAHWDHLGIGEKIKGDSIYNGAVDNATGVAALLELAAAFQKSAQKPERSIVFVSFTGEEQGLIGSEFYAKHPVFPVNKTIADINMDMMGMAGKTKDIIVYGFGQSDLEDYAAASAKKQGRVVVPDPVPSSGLYYRSDHFNFAKVGIPSLFTGSGSDNVEHGKEWGLKKIADFYKEQYHSPQDNFDPKSDVSGMVEDVRLLFDMGYRLSNESTFPKWKDGSEFKAIREKK